jgi:glycosyltransferase 2 family protein
MKRLLKVSFAVGLIWLLLGQIDLRALADAFTMFRWWSIVVAVALFFASCAVAASKWRLLWDKATWWEMLLANFASQFYSMILPGQLAGEAVKTFKVGRRFRDTSGVAASVVVDRVTGLVGLLVLACVGALLSSSSIARAAIYPLLLATVALAGVLYALAWPFVLKAAVSALTRVGGSSRWLASASRKMVAFVTAWASLLARPGRMLVAIGLGIVFQVLCVCINVVVAADLGIGVAFYDWCWILGLVSVAVLLPVTVAGIGIREGVYAGVLSLLGVPLEQAIAISIVVFGISLVGALIGGLVELRSPGNSTPGLSGQRHEG